MSELNKCPACGSDAATGYSDRALFNIQGWTTDCIKCVHGPRVTRFTREESQEAWNQLTKTISGQEGGSAKEGSK